MSEKNTLLQWIDERLPIITMARKHLIDYPTPKNLNVMWNFGSLAGVMLIIMILTGWFLATHYVADTQQAFASVQHIMRDVNYGWLIRFIHMNGSSFFFILLYLHLLRGLYYGSYKKPRELLWIIGVLLLVLVMVTAFVGYVLPWGQMSYWGATVITNLFSAIPWIGEDIVTLILGGYSVDQPTLTRFFAIHFLIPFIIVGLTFIHLMALHVTKSNNPLGVEVKTQDDTVPFHPYYTGKDLLGLVVFLFIFAVIVFFFPYFFSEPENAIPANPLVTPEHIVPEWYFLPYYAMLRAIPDKLLGVIVMFGAVFVLFLVPWLDRHPIKSALFRPLYRQFFFIFIAVVLILGWCGSNPPQGIYVAIARWATAYYYAFFLVIMPLLSRFEKGRPPPESIHAAERMKL